MDLTIKYSPSTFKSSTSIAALSFIFNLNGENLSKFILTLEMIAGRLEIFPILVLFTKNTWTKK